MTTEKKPALPLRCQEEKCSWFLENNGPDCACPDLPRVCGLTFANSPIPSTPCPHFKAVAPMTAEKKPRLCWRQQPREKGLAAITQGKRGWDLQYGDRTLICVRPVIEGFDRHNARGWYWYGGDEALWIPHRNTSQYPTVTADQATEQAMQHVKAHMKRPNGA